jgi:hypothetical protein
LNVLLKRSLCIKREEIVTVAIILALNKIVMKIRIKIVVMEQLKKIHSQDKKIKIPTNHQWLKQLLQLEHLEYKEKKVKLQLVIKV